MEDASFVFWFALLPLWTLIATVATVTILQAKGYSAGTQGIVHHFVTDNGRPCVVRSTL